MPVGIESERRREEPTGNAKGQRGRIEEEEEEEEAHHGPSYSAVFREGRSSKDEGSNVLVGSQTYSELSSLWLIPIPRNHSGLLPRSPPSKRVGQ
ncbi:hypothetical protein HZH68_014449 [Vespula germanica]|uniref:Uncharacterized protein n=1 Tax=Vespula germanica TaxID=30212 RepID=A0A834J943_VESGE|nr:hypothetical protein HZH68_014449 [Vespula germanica]